MKNLSFAVQLLVKSLGVFLLSAIIVFVLISIVVYSTNIFLNYEVGISILFYTSCGTTLIYFVREIWKYKISGNRK